MSTGGFSLSIICVNIQKKQVSVYLFDTVVKKDKLKKEKKVHTSRSNTQCTHCTSYVYAYPFLFVFLENLHLSQSVERIVEAKKGEITKASMDTD